jgi:TfoX/Sxy family transcriptional regulator of competence genes
MPYDESLGLRIQKLLTGRPGLEQKKMFGGVGFLLNGNMACGVHKDFLIVRVGANNYQAALAQPHAGVFDMTGRPMTGWIKVTPPGFDNEAALATWVELGWGFALSLPPK